MREELIQLGGGAHALAIQILGNHADAEDAVHDAIATVLGKPGAYDANKGPLNAWFLRIVRNRSIDLLRKRRPTEPADDIRSAATGPEQAAENAERDHHLERALATLDRKQREIIVLRDYIDLGYAQIAEILDIAPGTVMSRLHRARTALAEAYRAYDD